MYSAALRGHGHSFLGHGPPGMEQPQEHYPGCWSTVNDFVRCPRDIEGWHRRGNTGYKRAIIEPWEIAHTVEGVFSGVDRGAP